MKVASQKVVNNTEGSEPAPLLVLGQAPLEYRVVDLHVDHLGSIRLTTDEVGNVLSAHEYFPFGEEILPMKARTRKAFTGHERDSATGLDYMLARYYSASSVRFCSADPVIGVEENAQSWNRYAYVMNDPLNFTDPSGLCVSSASATGSTRSTQICQSATSLDTSQQGLDAIVDNENGTGQPVPLTVYDDGSNNPTVGTGHLVTPADNLSLGQTISQARADALFASDIQVAESIIEVLVGSLPVSQEEFDALVDLAFNVGPTELNAANSPGLNAAIAARNYSAIAINLVYTKDNNGVRQPGLVKRSTRRQNIFRSGNYARIP